MVSLVWSVRVRVLVSIALGAVLLGCDSNPQVSPSPAGSAAPTSSTPAPTTTPVVTAAPTVLPSALTFRRAGPAVGFKNDAVRGEPGWVTSGLGDPGAPTPDVWFSADGQEWQNATVRGDAFELTRVAWANGAFYGVGTRCNVYDHPQYCDFDGVAWRSTDGLTWKRIGGSGLEKVGFIEGPLAASNGALVLGWVYARNRNGVYWSRDGVAWTRVDPQEFGITSKFDGRVDVIASDSGFTLISVGCKDCPPRIYTSANGRRWQLVAELDVADARDVSLASDGSRTVAAVITCSGDACRTEIWSSSAGGPWASSATLPASGTPSLTFAGTAFVFAGEGRNVYLSRDGSAWSEVTEDFGDDPPRILQGAGHGSPCEIEFLAGGNGDIVLGAEQCGAWRAALP